MAQYSAMLALLVLGVAYVASGQLVGAPQKMTRYEIDNDKIFLGAIEAAVTKYSEDTGNSYVRTEIFSATRQVVSGLKYVADVELRRSLCVNDPRTKIAPCPEDISNPTRCIFTVVFQGWKSPQYTVLPSKCFK